LTYFVLRGTRTNGRSSSIRVVGGLDWESAHIGLAVEQSTLTHCAVYVTSYNSGDSAFDLEPAQRIFGSLIVIKSTGSQAACFAGKIGQYLNPCTGHQMDSKFSKWPKTSCRLPNLRRIYPRSFEIFAVGGGR
jgi:hypothetical protein